MTSKVDKQLLKAVLEPRKSGAIKAIEDAISNGADPNALTPDTSTSMGHVPAGRTLLTHSVHEEASAAVSQLLECGADPSLRDALGWTPWMASTLIDGSKQRRIQEALKSSGADTSGEHIGQLVRAVYAGDVGAADSLKHSDDDFRAIASFRVDLVGHQVRGGSLQMLEYLLANGMTASSTNLLNAVRGGNAEAVDTYLNAGQPPEQPDKQETPLMVAAGTGNLAIVQRLVAAGADVNRHADEDGEWTPAKYASSNSHKDVAEWLTAQMTDEAIERVDELVRDRNPKFKALYDVGTASEEHTTDEIVRVLEDWDEQYGLTVDGADGSMVNLMFTEIPADPTDLLASATALCPDLSEDPDALQSYLVEKRQLTLWWD